jgi:hypothetical protein
MENFLIGIEQNKTSGEFVACYAEGQDIALNADNYHDAVVEADLLDIEKN